MALLNVGENAGTRGHRDAELIDKSLIKKD